MPKITRYFVFPDGQIKKENELTQEIKTGVAQKIQDTLLVPFAYEDVMQEYQKEKAIELKALV